MSEDSTEEGSKRDKEVKMPIMPPNLLDYFPETKGDGLQITWAHGVNSKAKLIQALRGPAMMLEADVSMSCNSRYPVPIMAHPPAMTSDLTLDEWLLEVIRHNGKGIKLDFKSTEVVEPACRVLARVFEQFRGPVILNADILPGPNNQSMPPVDAWTFLTLGRTRFPKAIISIGWTMDYMPLSNNGLKMGYSREMTDRMVSLVKEYSLLQPVTFPVSAPLLKYSVPELQRLLFQVPNSSLTVWSHKAYPVSLEDLICIRKSFGISQVFYDLPDDLMELFYSVT